jgi:hypothetical protein
MCWVVHSFHFQDADQLLLLPIGGGSVVVQTQHSRKTLIQNQQQPATIKKPNVMEHCEYARTIFTPEKIHHEKPGWALLLSKGRRLFMNSIRRLIKSGQSFLKIRRWWSFANKKDGSGSQDLPSSEIAKGFILAHHVAERVIISGGANNFLKSGNFHSPILSDFAATTRGIKANRLNEV